MSEFEFGDEGEKDIVKEAKQDYSEKKQAHEDLKAKLVEEHGSATEVVDLGNGVTVTVDSSPGIQTVRELKQLSQKVDNVEDEDEMIDNMREWCDGLAMLIEDDEWTGEFLYDLADTDIQAFSAVVEELIEVIAPEDFDEDVMESFPSQ